MDGGVFAEGIFVSDDEVGGFADVFQILGLLTYCGEGEEGVRVANGAGAFDDDVGFDDVVRAEGDVFSDDGVGAYLSAFAYFC